MKPNTFTSIRQILGTMEELLDVNFEHDTNLTPSYYDLEQLIIKQNNRMQQLERTIQKLQHSVDILTKMHNNFIITIRYIDYKPYFASNIGTTFNDLKDSIKTKQIPIEIEELDFSDMILDFDSVAKIKHLFNLKRVKMQPFIYTQNQSLGHTTLSRLNLSHPDMPGFPYMYDPNIHPEQAPLQLTLL